VDEKYITHGTWTSVEQMTSSDLPVSGRLASPLHTCPKVLSAEDSAELWLTSPSPPSPSQSGTSV